MKRLLAVAFLLLAGVAVWRSAIDTPDPFVLGSQLRADESSKLTQGGSNTVFPTDFGLDESSEALREKYVQQVRAKAQLMSDKEIQQALAATNVEIRALQAKQKLDQLTEELRELGKDFEDTPSAETAKRMLEVHDHGPGPVPAYSDAPFYSPGTTSPARPTPIPDPNALIRPKVDSSI